jgi:hypothetical protein
MPTAVRIDWSVCFYGTTSQAVARWGSLRPRRSRRALTLVSSPKEVRGHWYLICVARYGAQLSFSSDPPLRLATTHLRVGSIISRLRRFTYLPGKSFDPALILVDFRVTLLYDGRAKQKHSRGRLCHTSIVSATEFPLRFVLYGLRPSADVSQPGIGERAP